MATAAKKAAPVKKVSVKAKAAPKAPAKKTATVAKAAAAKTPAAKAVNKPAPPKKGGKKA